MTATGTTGPAPVTVPVTLPPGFTLHNIAALVRDVVVAMKDMRDILRDHGLTQAQYDSLAANQFFKNVLEEGIKNWHAPQTTKERLALGALLALEDALPKIGARMTAGRESLADVVETAKMFADLAGIGPKSVQGPQTAPGEKFQININLGAHVQHIDTTRAAVEIQPLAQGTSAVEALRPVIEGASADIQLQPNTPRSSEEVPVRPLSEGVSPESEILHQAPIETGL